MSENRSKEPIEAPYDKAKRLGVSLIQPSNRTEEDVTQYRDVAWKAPIVGICGGCGKEIRLGSKREPCGLTQCPFGIAIH